MEIRIQSVKFDADQKLVDFVNKKVIKLKRFFDNIILAEVVLSFTPDHDNKKVHIRLNIPGNELVIDRNAKTFEKAVRECVNILKQQLKKTKEKMRRH